MGWSYTTALWHRYLYAVALAREQLFKMATIGGYFRTNGEYATIMVVTKRLLCCRASVPLACQ